MPKTVKAAIMRAPHQPIELGELPWPELTPGGAMPDANLSGDDLGSMVANVLGGRR